MSLAKELFPNCQEDGWFDSPYDYEPIINSFGVVAVSESGGDYSGDTFVLYDRGGDKFGYLVFGWGSCSGCDMLQSCGSYQDVDDIIDRLESDIQVKSREDMLSWLLDDEVQSTKFYMSDEAWKTFRQKAVEYLGKR